VCVWCEGCSKVNGVVREDLFAPSLSHWQPSNRYTRSVVYCIWSSHHADVICRIDIWSFTNRTLSRVHTVLEKSLKVLEFCFEIQGPRKCLESPWILSCSAQKIVFQYKLWMRVADCVVNLLNAILLLCRVYLLDKFTQPAHSVYCMPSILVLGKP